MRKKLTAGLSKPGTGMKRLGRYPAGLALLPAVCLGLFWFGGETALIVSAMATPVAVFLLLPWLQSKRARMPNSALTGVMRYEDFGTAAAQAFDVACEQRLKTAAFVVEIDGANELARRYGPTGANQIACAVSRRISSAMRDKDPVCLIDDFRVAICLEPVRRLSLETCIQLAGRLQAAVAEAITLDGLTIHLTGSVGFCQQERVATRNSEAWLDAASFALTEAQQNGPGAIRAYSEEMRRRTQSQADLRSEVTEARELGQICAWFQPQISTDTGLVTGFEALARWRHPSRGMIPPGEFLPTIEKADLLERLADVMMSQAFAALRAWDEAGVSVPQVGVNFAGPELRNPKLVDKVAWELDRFDLAPSRLAVEVLETVVSNAPDDIVARNINALGKLGCRIDLDDFGTGHASIASIRRFTVSRIKIDRSFVTRSDRDPDQQRMVSAILTMAERLGVETLAEGVETAGEHALLSQLGCDHVQGFGIGKPMAFDQTLDWIANHTAKLQAAPQILGNRRG